MQHLTKVITDYVTRNAYIQDYINHISYRNILNSPIEKAWVYRIHLNPNSRGTHDEAQADWESCQSIISEELSLFANELESAISPTQMPFPRYEVNLMLLQEHLLIIITNLQDR